MNISRPSTLIALFLLIFTAWKSVFAAEPPGALEPPSILKPLPEEYSDEKRMFQGIPSMTIAPKGRIWATWYTGGVTEDHNNYVVLVTSGDAGKTWTKPLFAIDVPGPVRCYDPAMWTDPDGKVWLFWSQSYYYDGRVGVWCMTTDTPDREDAEWSPPRRLCDGTMMCKPIADSKERWLLPSAIWNEEGRKIHPEVTLKPGANLVVSEDRGKTWAFLGAAAVPKKDALYDEHNIIEKKDGTFWLWIRTKYGIAEAFSKDAGKTWTDPQPSAIKHPTSRFFVRRLKSGNLILVKNGPLDKQTGRSHMTAFLSSDDGTTWKGGLLLDERNNVSYPDGDQMQDDTIFVVYDRERMSDKEILMARFTEADILAQKIVSETGALKLLVNKACGIVPVPEPLRFTADPNSDGVPFQAGMSPEMEFDGQHGVLQPGARLFTNRNYVANNYPKELLNKRFLRGPIDGVSAICKGDGIVYVLTPSPERNNENVTEYLAKNGFEKVAYSEMLLFGNTTTNIVTLYQKKVVAGEKILFGKWGLLVY